MSSAAATTSTSAATQQPPPPIVRPCSVRAALWINSHPKSLVLALLVLAAGYGVALGCGGLPKDVLIGVAVAGGIVLAVSAYVLKRLIFIPDLRRLQYLFGISDLKNRDAIYWNNQAGVACLFEIWASDSQNTGGATFSTNTEGAQFLTEMGVTTSFSNPSEKLLQTLRQTLLENEKRTDTQMLRWVFAEKGDGIPEKVKVRDNNTSYEISFLQKNGGWVVTLPTELYRKIHPTTTTLGGIQSFECPLIGPRFCDAQIVNYLRSATIETWTKGRGV